MRHYYIKAKSFLLEDRLVHDQYLEVLDGVFGQFVEQPPQNAKVIDWSAYMIAPGLFDTHIHGLNGHDVMDGTVEAVQGISEVLPSVGVTRFLPTTLTSKKTELNQAIQAVKEAVNDGLPGARSEGIFLEGPYFTEKHKGAQNPAYFRNPDIEEFQEWQTLAEGSIVKVALAPEREGAIDFIRHIRQKDVLPSIAHTDASYACCQEAVQAGARQYVHLFNGMSGLHHRKPGVVGAALMDPNAYVELICDGHHVHPDVASWVATVKEEKLVLITDCIRAGFLPDGNYHLGEFPVILKDGVARTETGSLAGSTLTLIEGVKNLYQWTRNQKNGKSLSEVWHYASLSPAKSLGLEDELGSLSSGKRADFVVIDEALNVQATAVDGELKYRKMKTR